LIFFLNLLPRKKSSSITIAIVSGIPTQRSRIRKPARSKRIVAASEKIAEIRIVGQKTSERSFSTNRYRKNKIKSERTQVRDSQNDE